MGDSALSECIVWHRSCDTKGYGQIAHKGKLWRIHRLAYTQAYGPIPAGLMVCHRCDNPPCYNLDHLFLGAMKDNMQDCARKGRNNPIGLPKAVATYVAMRRAETHCKRGHELSGSNLHIKKTGNRLCKTCRSMREAGYAAARKLAREKRSNV